MHNKYLQIATKLVNSLKPVSLAEMDSVILMDRTDMKFVLSFDLLPGILVKLSENYKVLSIQDKKVFSYRTEYFDTPDLTMYFDHHNGKLNRYKVRHREYIESSLSFLEVKFKTNKGRVIKQRIENNIADQHLFSDFISKHTPYNPKNLYRTVINHFNRFTLVDLQMHERVTIDINLSFTDGIQHVALSDLVIIEVKQNIINRESLIYQVLKGYSLRPIPISKYCIGISLLSGKPKANNFKQVIMKINQMSHVEYNA
jgi:hypothetical protein